MNMENKYTPELIATSQFKFSIPLYQRLFAWKRKEVTKLLFDLKEHFAKMPADEPYYLGKVRHYIKKIVPVDFLHKFLKIRQYLCGRRDKIKSRILSF